MKTVLPNNFKLPSNLDLKNFMQSDGRYSPSHKQLGITEQEFNSLNSQEMGEYLRVYNAWYPKLVAERNKKLEEKRIEKNKDHWFFVFDDERKRELICKTLSLKIKVLTNRMIKPNLSKNTTNLYMQAEKAEEKNFIMKDISPMAVIKYLPYYSEEHDCLYGGDSKLIYCWITFFSGSPKSGKRKLQNIN